MNLIQWKNNKITISPEAYGIKAFRDIWNADKTKGKDKAILELTALYFIYDPRSDYKFITDEDERIEKVILEMGLPDKWKPNKLFENAIPVYISLVYTTSASLLDGNRIAANSIKKVIETPIEDLELDPSEKLVYVEKLTNVVIKSNSLAKDIAQAEKDIYKDVEEHSAKMRGKGDRTIGDEGFDNLFN